MTTTNVDEGGGSGFDRLAWAADDSGFRLAGFDFRIEQLLPRDDADEGGYIRVYKTRAMVEQYRRLFDHRQGWTCRQAMELGVWDGGSAAFWNEVLEPERFLAVDVRAAPLLGNVDAYRASARGGALSFHWGVDQADAVALRNVLSSERIEHLDLVIDDASHHYVKTCASFATLFPRLRPGGLYVIEDWAWSLNPKFLAANPHWRQKHPLASIVLDLAANMAVHRGAIANVEVLPAFVAVERGPAPLLDDFALQTDLVRRRPPAAQIVASKARKVARELRSRLRLSGR